MSADQLPMTLVVLAAKASVILGAAGATHLLLRRRASAATRHWVWTVTTLCLLALPALALALPSWTIAVPVASIVRPVAGNQPPQHAGWSDGREPHQQAPSAAEPADDAVTTMSATSMLQWPAVVAAIYAAGLFLLLVRLGVQHLAARRLVRTAEDMRDAAWRRLLAESKARLHIGQPVRLLRSRERSMPMAIGIGESVILMPSIADTWPADRRRAVLLHELAHVGRRDCLTQGLAAIACALYWPHPGVWWVARRLRVERELACDDRVLRAGTAARDYAGHLLEIAYSLGGHRAPALAVSMARPGQLEGRMLAVLDTARNRRTPGPVLRLAGTLVATVALLPLAVLAATTMPTETIINADSLAPVDAAAVQATTSSRFAGSWSVRTSEKAGMVHLEMREDRSSSGTSVPLAQLEGLSQSQMAGEGTPVRFTLRRDAGTFAFEGTFRGGVGGGTYAFSANPAFAADLEKRGIGRVTPAEQYDLARHDVGLALLDELSSQGYQRPTVADLIKSGHHGVRLEFVREIGQLGYRLGTVESLIRLRDHGVSPTFVRELSAEGYTKLSADELVRVRDHGVSTEFIKQMRAMGYTSLTLEQLVNARDHGVSAEFAREMKALGFDKVSLADLVRARDHGVSTEYIRELKALGYENLPLDELVRLRDHGVSADRVKRANEKAGTRLPPERLRSLAAHGWK